MKTTIKITTLLLMLSLSVVSCKDDEFEESIFDTNIGYLDPNSYTYEFDKWLYDNYIVDYNLDFRYRMQDVGSNLDYNLVPVTYEKAQQMAKLVKYLWFDVYETKVGKQFLRDNGPRIIHLIGSSAYNPDSGTEILGTAEGGLKVTLYRCNKLNPKSVDDMNEYYFKTMHHEFSHILHQKKSYPTEFNLLSAGKYNPKTWQDWSDDEANSLGFVTNYAGSEAREDFVEVIANRLVLSDDQWNAILTRAENTPNEEGIKGKELILQKYEIAKKWLAESWNIDIEAMRAEILERQNNVIIHADNLDDLFQDQAADNNNDNQDK
ncbi:MAG: hypothetical protein DBY16_06590 [Coprobacter sp.]|jgi:hypothetical protein|uniref:zinc-binding metallopeptidase n=1 Tax=Barnesiella propionica TaxID=2981781 RepID=UPI000D792661|nr:putative zinc-binding metallopeptidase [Barnesiella propionica]MBO1734101.1 hypothetical protein [Barnesiella sp. GGCC_0306]MBS7038690.1 putative zinc-binding metallopeptidase [Bacteroidales bacterium]MCU6769742.1 putative zinc-binding metallopeptidase [Barnesiella propionica]PWM90855.1 MAG: hypothetical protein DBY16_06590 [Coprobacter sp.]